PLVLRTLALAATIFAVARPQTGISDQEVVTEGIDIVLALDLSSSMLAEDLQPNRFAAAKLVAADFVAGRPHDRLGLVAFAGHAFTQVPLTLDHSVVTQLIDELEVGAIEDGTAIGMGLATALKRLQRSNAESKVVILLTDGRNNAGQIDPVTAAHAAQSLGVKIYAIGAGTIGQARVPINDPTWGRRYAMMRVDIDEPTLRQTAELTGGRYFRATDNESLAAIFDEIDQLEKTEIQVQHFTRYGELFHYPLSFGLLFLTLELALSHTVLRRTP
ncbi:MAG: VWA domain-containing protein, partial [Gemmatimonadales bacterium]